MKEDPSSDRGTDPPVTPLTRRNADAVGYRREPAVERQIREALTLRPDQLRERVRIGDRESPGYLKEESLIYLIRHHRQTGELRLVNDISEALLRRCARLIDSRLNRLGGEAARDGYNDVVERLFAQVLDFESDRGDFLQVRFWVALERLAIRAFNEQLKQHKRVEDEVSLSSLAGHDRDEDDAAGRNVRPHPDAEAGTPTLGGEAAVERNDLIQDALSRLEEPYRSAFLLRHHAGWPIEDKDPSVRTISRHYGKDPRTVRNWLRRAKETLEQWRGEQ